MSLMARAAHESWVNWEERKRTMNIKREMYDGQMQMLWKTKENYARWLRDLDIRDREVHGAQNKID